ncbi:MAG TPA: glycoside hydrolase family 3 C-terminal domain-containing protein [Acidimicrobiales bacterium]|nr:glycoside hydrolase family 3 C-terminal domain-containing protein [Acidimicrobiales bacterium]
MFPSPLTLLARVAVPLVVLSTLVAQPAGASSAPLVRPHLAPGPSCPWVAASRQHRASPATLAGEVLARMTLAEKVGYVILQTHPSIENSNTAVPSLCLPSLTMTDGPNGLADGLVGVTQLPAAIGIAASFDPQLASAVAHVEALEARTKGFTAVQGPELNLARVPTSGRIFESFGEDPYLTSVMGTAAIQGIQSTGVMADAKHLSAYTQETARAKLNQSVSQRVLAELYDAPFRAAVVQGHVASFMCSYGSLNGVNTCSDPRVYSTLRSWGFNGFVRSDLRAITNFPAAFRAGMTLVKPAPQAGLVDMVRRGAIPVSVINDAVRRVLIKMFAFGVIARQPQINLGALATSPAHVAVATRAAQAGVVLLKNNGVLPLGNHPSSIALLGTSAALDPVVNGLGSAEVRAPYVVTPLAALRRSLPRTKILYSPGGLASFELDQLSDVDVIKGTPLRLARPIKRAGEPGKGDISVEHSPNVTPAISTATTPGTSEGWTNWSITVRAHKSGVYEFALQGVGDTWIYVNGHVIMADRGLHAPSQTSTTVTLTRGHDYTISAKWFQVRNHRKPHIGIVDVTPRINAAVALAKRARVAVVVVGDQTSEGYDRVSLNLSGDANALISAVAKVNPRTVVVLNTGGAVLMPWLHQVAAVLEAWYPGQVDGNAIAPILTGAVDPSGRLPLTFPATSNAVPDATANLFPGVNGTVSLGSLSSLGYRWYQAHGVRPLFPFGYGLAYTTFHLGHPRVTGTHHLRVIVPVTNTGRRRGVEVVEAYVHYPASLGEPPEQLRAFTRVTLAPGQTRRAILSLAPSAFTVFRAGHFVTVAGTYRIDVGRNSADLAYHLSVARP